MSGSTSVRSGSRRGSVSVPRIPCPYCNKRVKMLTSQTSEHEGWVFFRCANELTNCDFWHWELDYVVYLMDHQHLVGDDAIEAFGEASERREELEEIKRKKLAVRRQAERAAMGRQADRDAMSQPGMGRPLQIMTKHEARALLHLGRELLMVMKMVLASMLVLCVVTVVSVLKK